MAATARPRWDAVRRFMTDISSSSVVSTRLWTPWSRCALGHRFDSEYAPGETFPPALANRWRARPCQLIDRPCDEPSGRSVPHLFLCAVDVARSYGSSVISGSFGPLASEWMRFRVKWARGPAGRDGDGATQNGRVPDRAEWYAGERGDLVVSEPGEVRQLDRRSLSHQRSDQRCSKMACVSGEGPLLRTARAMPSPRSRRSGLRCPGARVRR